jgi:hypothetical protein
MFDFDEFCATAKTTSRLTGFFESWRVRVWHHDDDSGMLVTVCRALPGAPYEERAVYVTRAGSVHWDASVDGGGWVVDANGVRMEEVR